MRKKTILTVILGVVAMTTIAQQRAIPRDEVIEQKVAATLQSMTLEQKVGQMCEITIDVLSDRSETPVFKLNKEMTDKVLSHYKVGSILNVPLSTAQKPEAWSTLIRELNRISTQTSGIAELYGVDQIHGASYTWGATLFPQEISQAASFNRDIPRKVSEIAAYESRACLIPWVYSPVLDLGRQPLWSRMWESYGEDVYLMGEMARQAVRGYQGDDPNHVGSNRVAACLKHFMAYGVPISGKDRTPSSVTEREMREKYFEPFRAAIMEGALSLMVNSGINNGEPFHANYRYLTTWLKDELGWDGMIVTDWADINSLNRRDHIAATKKDAICMAINAGIDMSMVPYELDFCDLLIELVKEGRVSMSRIDDAVSRILRLKYRLGLDNKKTWDKTPKQLTKEFSLFGSRQFADEATAIATECMVLLKNNSHLLPLAENSKILVCGPNADNLRGMNGGWSYTWQGERTNELAPQMGYYPTFQQALKDRFGNDRVTFVEGVQWDLKNFDKDHPIGDWNELVDKARENDVVIVCLGENSYCETPGNIVDLNLSPNQKALVETLAKAGKPIVMVLAEGRPRVLKEIEPLCQAAIHTFLSGNYGGRALASLLAGDDNFSGRMPYTYPKHTGSLQTYDYKPCENVGLMEGEYNYDAVMDVQWPFGHGLSYTTFTYSNLRADKTRFNATDDITLSIDITNNGNRNGKESVLFYISDLVATITPDIKRLNAFEKVTLAPGETKTVSVTIPASQLAFVGADMRWRLEQGEFRVVVGDQTLLLTCSDTYIWTTPNR